MNLNLSEAKNLLKDICDEYRKYDKYIMQGVDGENAHGLNVLEWVERLNPKASFALQLSALFHDIDRVVTLEEGGGFKGDRKSKAYLKHKKNHAQRSVNFIIPRLRKLKVDKITLKRVQFLILHHDDTGKEVEELNNPELNYLVAADTFSFFTSIWPKLLATEGMSRLKDKIRFMVDKIPDSLRDQLFELQLEEDETNKVKNEIVQEYWRHNNPTDKVFKFCPSCSSKLVKKNINRRNHPYCSKCNFTYWGNPRLCTSVILEREDKVMLVKRNHTPLRGFWCLPGGIVEYHELVEEALIREAREETGYEIVPVKLVGIYQIDNDPKGVGQDVIYFGKIKSGTGKVSEEHKEIKYFLPNRLPKLIAYKHRRAISDYLTKKIG